MARLFLLVMGITLGFAQGGFQDLDNILKTVQIEVKGTYRIFHQPVSVKIQIPLIKYVYQLRYLGWPRILFPLCLVVYRLAKAMHGPMGGVGITVNETVGLSQRRDGWAGVGVMCGSVILHGFLHCWLSDCGS